MDNRGLSCGVIVIGMMGIHLTGITNQYDDFLIQPIANFIFGYI